MPVHREFLPDPLPPEPLAVAASWLAQAQALALQPNPNAMVLATADAQGMPSARVVLCKELLADPGVLTFYTNYLSRKGRELNANPHAAAVMHWDVLRRQLRVEGRITRTTAAESDTYFASRAWQSRIGAWASEQSAPLATRGDLHASVKRVAERFGAPMPGEDLTAADPGVAIPRPPHWGGFHLWAESVELWVEGSARIHERARWTRVLLPAAGGFTPGPWSATRLQP
jgi:pyridoxamine 5'-phosphate oxidase